MLINFPLYIIITAFSCTFAFPLGFPFEGSKCKYTEKTTAIRFLFLGGRKNGTFPSPRFAPKVDTGVTGTLVLWRTQPYLSCGDRLIAQLMGPGKKWQPHKPPIICSWNYSYSQYSYYSKYYLGIIGSGLSHRLNRLMRVCHL